MSDVRNQGVIDRLIQQETVIGEASALINGAILLCESGNVDEAETLLYLASERLRGRHT